MVLVGAILDNELVDITFDLVLLLSFIGALPHRGEESRHSTIAAILVKGRRHMLPVG